MRTLHAQKADKSLTASWFDLDRCKSAFVMVSSPLSRLWSAMGCYGSWPYAEVACCGVDVSAFRVRVLYIQGSYLPLQNNQQIFF